ncbi:hypothetical protein EON76_03605 [bacterium]|nr:MAG: hypothetical protein EON76_03605 [bacterium]
MSHTSTTSNKFRSFSGLVVGVGLTTIAILLFLNKQYVYDTLSFYQYEPTAAVAGIAERTTMTDKGRFYFYASHPRIDGAQAFNQECNRHEESSAILGCYNGDRIFVYDVTDAQLDGIKEVTATHEMFHAVYQRMSQDERNRLNQLLQDEYKKHADNKELADRMAFYERTEPGQENNELHSILGTEFGGLSPELEGHYVKYVANRQVIVDLHTKYAAVFNTLKSKSESLAAQLKQLGSTIESDSASYNKSVGKLNTAIQSFNARAASGDFSSQAAFNREKNQLMSQISQLDASKNAIDRSVATYESLRLEYNQTAAASNKLYESLNSNLAPTPSV